jgi:hypothetical protein
MTTDAISNVPSRKCRRLPAFIPIVQQQQLLASGELRAKQSK